MHLLSLSPTLTPLLLGLALLPVVSLLTKLRPRDLRAGFRMVYAQVRGRRWWTAMPSSVPQALAVATRYAAAQLVVLTGWLVALAFLAGFAWGQA